MTSIVKPFATDSELERVHRYHAIRSLACGKTILDVGCGNGDGSNLLAEVASLVVGIDIDRDLIAGTTSDHADANLKFRDGDILSIPAEKQFFDIVVSFETDLNSRDQDALVREVRRVLKPGGLFIFSWCGKHQPADRRNIESHSHPDTCRPDHPAKPIYQHFSSFALYGQRSLHSSILAPLEPDISSFVLFHAKAEEVVEIASLPHAGTLIAVASDGSLPRLSTGVMIPNPSPNLNEVAFLNQELHKQQRAVSQLGQDASAWTAAHDDHVRILETKIGDLERDADTIISRHEGQDNAFRSTIEALEYDAVAQSQAVNSHIRILETKAGDLEQKVISGASVIHELETSIQDLKSQLSESRRHWIWHLGRFLRPTNMPQVDQDTGPASQAPGELSRPDEVRKVTTVPETADGKWEWSAYERVRDRIADVLNERRASQTLRARPCIELDARHLDLAASRIVLAEPSGTPVLSIIVPVYNEIKVTLECLQSIAASDISVKYEIIVADDASTDRTRELLSGVRHLRVLTNKRNLGFLLNCNNAAAHAKGEYLIFINNDAQVVSGSINALMEEIEKPLVGAVGPRFVYPNGTLQEAGVRIRREGAVEMIGIGQDPDDRRWSYARDVEYVSGACLAIETSLFMDLGGFDASLAPAYCEDLDLCMRIRERGLQTRYVPQAEVIHHLSVSSNALGESYKTTQISRNMQLLSEKYQARFDAIDDFKLIALYLPQFHPTPENDLWWGPGFTEWTNVAKARPNFEDHYQPRLPADLGYYDLRVGDVIEKQEQLAERYGIDGFCYYYYWFDGHRLLDKPLARLQDLTRPTRPFCLCWANENWTRRWDGQDHEVLMAQSHSVDDDVAVIRDLAKYIRNPSYIRINGRPLLLVYRVDLFPAFAETADRWREECRKLKIGDPFITMVESFRFAGDRVAPSLYGCDASMQFPAHFVPDAQHVKGLSLNAEFDGAMADYEDAATKLATMEHPGFKQFRAVMPGWDNTARRQNGSFILENSSPGAFRAWLEQAIAETQRDLCGEERILFVNAWNEWAEGAYLEPDKRFGHSYLEAVRNARDARHLVRI